MKIKGLDGRTYSWKLENGARDMCSSYHQRARNIIPLCFPADLILEELVLPGTPGSGLRADFFIPQRMLLIEIQGEQHYKHNKFFHKNKLDFLHSVRRDKVKNEWCQLNGIRYVTLPYWESDEQWTDRLLGRTNDL